MAFKLISVLFLFTISVFNQQFSLTEASCPGNKEGEGSVTFYWRENAEARKGEMRNWGKLEETLENNFYSRLNKYFDPKYAYAYMVAGDCCWKIFNETNYKGASEELKRLNFETFGFRGIPKYPHFNANSMKKVKCP